MEFVLTAPYNILFRLFVSKIGCGIRDVRVPMGQLPIMLARSIFVPQRI